MDRRALQNGQFQFLELLLSAIVAAAHGRLSWACGMEGIRACACGRQEYRGDTTRRTGMKLRCARSACCPAEANPQPVRAFGHRRLRKVRGMEPFPPGKISG